VILAVLAAGWWIISGRPSYQPGMVREEAELRSPLEPPVQPEGDEFWRAAEDIELYHYARGEGRDVLVVHGGPGYPYREPLPGLAALEEDYRFHYYDQRGCGKSTRPIQAFESSSFYQNTQVLERTLGLSAQIADIERIRRILGQEKIILVGHSFGGFLASLYASEFPEHTAGLVLVAPADVLVMPQEGEDLFGLVREGLTEEDREAYDALVEEYFNFREIFAKTDSQLAALQDEFGTYFQRAAGGSEALDQGETGGWMVWAMYFSMGRRHDYRAALEKVSAPVLVLHGEEDLQNESVSRSYAGAFPEGRFRVIADAGHFPFREQPAAFAEVVGRFLDSLE